MTTPQTVPQRDDYDVIVVGGGPAGSTAATLIAREGGHRVLLVDRERFPRFRIGESLMPATYWTLDRLGVLPKMQGTEKYSVQFFNAKGKGTSPFYFHEFDDHRSSQTWQVDRLQFDTMLLEHAEQHGVEVCQQVNVKDVRMDGRQATGVDVELADGTRRSLSAKVTVDASGQTAIVARKLGLKTVDPQLRHAAIFTRFRGALRGEGIDAGATLIMHTAEEKSWFWYIPLPNDVMSVGVVGPIDYLLKDRKGTLQETFDAERAICPPLQERLAEAEQLEPAQALRDFSYISKQIAGDGWIMAGDAFGFLDPIYSTGVFLAMKSAEFAADASLQALEAGDLSGAQLGKYGERYLEGMENMRKLVYAYYDPNFSFATFLKDHPQYRENIIDLLVGNVYRKPIAGLFEAMADYCDLPETRQLQMAAKAS